MNNFFNKQNFFNFLKTIISSQFILLFCLTINAQQTEKFVKKLVDGTEVYQRKSETVTNLEQPYTVVDTSGNVFDLRFSERITQQLEVVLRKPGLNQEIIIWSDEHTFLDGRAFNYFFISDIYKKGNKFYLLYYKGLEVRVITAFEDSGVWHFENDTFLEQTSESMYPIIESKFVGKKPKVFARRDYGGFQEIIYEWELKKRKWVLTKKKEITVVPPWAKKYKSK